MYGKILIRGELELLTGMHIGGSATFSAIGAVDKPVVRDPAANDPILPGSTHPVLRIHPQRWPWLCCAHATFAFGSVQSHLE